MKYNNVKRVTLTAVNGADLEDSLYELMALSAGKVVKADADSATASVKVGIGILAENPTKDVEGADSGVPVALVAGGGIHAVKANAAIAVGNVIVPSTTAGKVAGVADVGSLADGQVGIGFALEAATQENDIIEILLMQVSKPNA